MLYISHYISIIIAYYFVYMYMNKIIYIHTHVQNV